MHVMGGVPPSGYASRYRDPFVPIPHPLSPLFSHPCALFCAFLHSSKTQLFYFQSLPHSLPKTPGGGVRTPLTPPAARSFTTVNSRCSHDFPPVTGHQSPPCPRSVCYPRLSVGGSSIPPSSEVLITKTLKIVLIVVRVLVAVILVPPSLIPVNQFRPIIAV